MKLFETRRTEVREFQREDIDTFIEYRNNSEWMIHQGFKDKTKEEYIYILLTEMNFDKGTQFAIIHKELNTLIGDIYIEKEGNTFWIGYTIHPVYKRQGFTFEVVSELIIYLRGLGNYHIKAGVYPENIPSIRLLEKLGFIYIADIDGEKIFQL